MSKFRVTSKPASPITMTAEEFSAGAAMVKTQTGGRPLKPIRINFDLDPNTHRKLKMRALNLGISAAQLIRQLIDNELSS